MSRITLLAISAFFFATSGCDFLSNVGVQNHAVSNPNNDNPASPDKYAYPPIEQQRIELERFSEAIEAMNDGADQLLRRMVERVPIQFIEKNLPELQMEETTSARARENMSKLLTRIRQFRELDHSTAPAFIYQARQREDVDALCVCIFALGTASLQAFAADALRTIGDPKSARCLLVRLYQAMGMPEISEGYEVRLRLSLTKAFGDVTHIDIAGFDGSDEDIADLKKIIQQGEIWLEEHEETQSGE